jgi:O-antigen ligase
MLFSYALAVTLLVPTRIFFSTLHLLTLGMSIIYLFALYYTGSRLTGPDWKDVGNVFDYKTAIGIVGALLVLLCSWMISEKRRVIISVFGIMLGLAIISFLSRSAVSLIIALVGIFSFYFFVFIRPATPPVKAVAFIFFILVSVITSSGIISSELDADKIIQLLGRDPTLTGRTTIWHEGYNFIIERPIVGYGYAILENLDDPLSYQLSGLVGYLPIRLPHLHNSWLNIALQFGLVGFFLYLITSIVLIWRAMNLYLNFDLKLGALVLAINLMMQIYSISESFFMGSREPFMFLTFIMLLMPTDISPQPTITLRHSKARRAGRLLTTRRKAATV